MTTDQQLVVKPLWGDIRAVISDAFYSARNAGETMEAAADRAATAVEQLMRPPVLPNPATTTAPGAFHSGGTDTERRAFEAFAMPRVGTLREKVLDELLREPNGLTDRQLAQRTSIYLYSIAPRRTELVRMGWVEDSGERRVVEGQRAEAVVWTLTDEGFQRWGTHRSPAGEVGGGA